MKTQIKELERSFFDAYAQEQEYDVFTPRSYRRLLNKLERVRKGLDGWQADLGCGTGAFTHYLLAPRFKTLSLDLSHQCLQKVKTQYPTVSSAQSDIEFLPLLGNSVNFLVFSAVLHHFPDFGKVATEAYRVLKPGGYGFACDPNEHNPIMYLYRSPNSPFSTKAGRTPNERNLTKKELKDVFQRAGFINVRVVSVSGILFKQVAEQNRLTLALYNIFELALEFTRLEKLLGSFLLTTFQKPW
jgi:SAM-dependent methyltransferase